MTTTHAGHARRPVPTLLRSLTAGLAAGAASGLLAAAATPLVRSWANVSNRDLINGASVVGLALAIWLAGGALYRALAPKVARPEGWVFGALAGVGALAALAIY